MKGNTFRLYFSLVKEEKAVRLVEELLTPFSREKERILAVIVREVLDNK